MQNDAFKFASPVFVAAVLGTAVWVNAGDLNPPPGEISPTNRVQLNEQAIDLPFTITESGSYVLTSDLTGVAGQHGIVVEADNVTLDLNGFALIGVPGSLDGISTPTQDIKNLAIRNGTVRNWGRAGINSSGFGSSNTLLEGLRSSNNGTFGAIVGHGSVVTGCAFARNGAAGLSADDGSTIVACTATDNSGRGFSVAGGCSVARCAAWGNSGDGFRTAATGTISDCSSRANNGHGITATNSLIHGNAATDNGGQNINATNCTLVANHTG